MKTKKLNFIELQKIEGGLLRSFFCTVSKHFLGGSNWDTIDFWIDNVKHWC